MHERTPSHPPDDFLIPSTSWHVLVGANMCGEGMRGRAVGSARWWGQMSGDTWNSTALSDESMNIVRRNNWLEREGKEALGPAIQGTYGLATCVSLQNHKF